MQISVGWIIYNPKLEKILLHRRSDRTWDIFGGDGDGGKTFKYALKNEMKNELEIVIDWWNIKFVCDYFVENVHRCLFLYLTFQENFEVHEGLGVEWFTFQEAFKILNNPSSKNDLLAAKKLL